MADAELQLITGHAKRETLAIYQHVALDGQLEERYQKAMRMMLKSYLKIDQGVNPSISVPMAVAFGC